MNDKASWGIYRQLRRALLLIGLGTLALVGLVNIGSLMLAHHMAQQGYWHESKFWKGQLLDVQLQAPEVVLVGSSRVQNHFDTRAMTLSGHAVFNFGVPGMLPWEFPSMVKHAGQAATRAVVISFPAQLLFQPVGCPTSWALSDLAYFSRHFPACLKDLPLSSWLQPLPINAVFDEAPTANVRNPCDSPTALRMMADQAAFQSSELCDDPRSLMLLRYSRRWVAIFANGDGLIVPDAPAVWQMQQQDMRGTAFNPQMVAFMSDLGHMVQEAGKTPIFIIEAAPVDHWTIDHNLEALTGVKTLYMNDMTFSDNEIADHDHLGVLGSRRATEWLYERLYGAEGLLPNQ